MYPNIFSTLKNIFISKFFQSKKLKDFKYHLSSNKFLDYLLWNWKNELSREWYTYLLNLKHDLQISNNELSINRILKTQTNPLQMVLLERKIKMNKIIGFIGLGNMGKGMSNNLSENNLKILGFDLNDKVFDELSNEKINKKDDIKSLTELSDIVITMLPDGNAVEQVWSEMIKFSNPKQYFIDCSTIDVKTSSLVQEKAQKKDVFTLDAPVSGGVIGANNGTLTFMIGGKPEVYKETKFLFDIMGKNSILCGDKGAGQSAKICNNMLLATTMIAVGESFKLGKKIWD